MNGFLVIDKCASISSYDVIRRLKRLHPFKKIGYIGTLDKNATGILPVAMDEGVKLIPFLEDVEKIYKARFLLGVTTDTLDIEGKILSSVETEKYERAMLEDTLKRYMGRISQQVPIYSSKKIRRRPLYKWARSGVPVETPQKQVEIFDIKLLGYDHPYVDIEVRCSKGTYIRVLAQDFGSALGCGATLFSLKRTQHGEFSEDMGIPVDHFNVRQDIANYVVTLENVLRRAKETVVEAALEKFLRHGMPVPFPANTREWKDGESVKLLDKQGTLIGVGIADTALRTIKIKKLINN